MQHRICLILVWYGDFPVWMPYFLRSAAACRNIDWLIFTDRDTLCTVPDNVRIENLAIAKLEEIVSEHVESEYRFSGRYYKVCDFKPAYGHFFEPWLKDYHYWGYTDLDVLIGNLPQKIESMLDSDPDVVTASLSLFVAHFTLLKNNNRCRLLYQECDDWRRIFLTDDCEIFDEKNFGRHIAHLSATGEIKVERKQIVEENLRYFWSGRPRYIILWYHGRLLAPLSLRQPGYFHFINTRYKPEFRVETDPDADAFYITNKGIYPHPRTHRLPAIRSSFLLHRIDYHSMVREADSEVSAAQPAHISAKKTRAWKCCLTAATSFQMQQCPSTGSIGWDFLFG